MILIPFLLPDLCKQMDVSENSGTRKSSILIGFSIINHRFWGTPIFGNTQMEVGSFIKSSQEIRLPLIASNFSVFRVIKCTSLPSALPQSIVFLSNFMSESCATLVHQKCILV